MSNLKKLQRHVDFAHKSTITLLLSVFLLILWCDHKNSLKNIFYPLYNLSETVFGSEIGRMQAMLLRFEGENS